MSFPEQPGTVAARLRTMQIIAGAIVLGAMMFLVIVVIVRTTGQMTPPPETPIITYAALGFAVLQTLAWTVVPDRIAAGAHRPISPPPPAGGTRADTAEPGDLTGRFYALYQTRLIVALALLEGAAFFLMIAYLVEGTPVSLLAAILFILGMALHFPTRAGIERWIEQQRQRRDEERLRGG